MSDKPIIWSPQQEAIRENARTGKGSFIVVARAGTGKCLGKDTPVLMFNGEIRPVQSICKGDFLMGPDSKPRKVLLTSSGRGPLFRITPVKGEPWICNDAHILTLVNSVTGEIFDIGLDEYIRARDSNRHRQGGNQTKGDGFPHRLSDAKLFRAGLEFPEIETTKPRLQKKNVLRTGFKVEPIGDGEYFGFTIDKDGRFLLGDLTVTHNSTTAVGLADLLQGKVAYLAYNKSAGKELKEKLEDRKIPWHKAKAGTVHSFGLEAWKRSHPEFDQRNGVQKYKVEDIILACQDDFTIAYKGTIGKLVSLAKQHAFGITKPIESRESWLHLISHFDILSDIEDVEEGRKVDVDKLVEASIKILKASNAKRDVIDFDDMCYLPIYLKLPFWQYDCVILDEAQDANEIRECVASAMLKKGGRFGAFGDDKQAIYGFTGSMSDALEKLRTRHSAIILPLTVTYRCPRKVVSFVKDQGWIEDYESHPDAPEGDVLTMHESELLAKKELLVAGNAVLCRVTKPLVTLAFRLIRAHVPCNIEGRDLAAGLVKLATKWKRAKDIYTLEGKLEDYLMRERTKLLAQRREDELAAIEDQVEAVRAIIDQCQAEDKENVSDVVDYINRLFQDGVERVLVLSTIHKAKGREWDTVIWYDRANTCPSKWARQQWQKTQETNLCYVASTRCRRTLIDLIADPKETSKKEEKPVAQTKSQEQESIT